MPFIAEKKKTILLISGTASSPDKKHLFIIITDKCNNNMHLLIPVCSIKDEGYFDQTCIIEVGEHPFITRRTYVAYARVMQRSSINLSNIVDIGNAFEKEPLADIIFEKVCIGVNNSRHTPKWAKIQYNSWPK